MTCPICAWTPGTPEYPLVLETAFWRAVLAPNQCLVGRCILHLKRHCGDLAEISPAELQDWLETLATLQAALRKAFGASMFNWSCYMNLSYREDPPDPHIHWWVVPRYAHPIRLAGLVFEDARFGSPYEHGMRREVSPVVREQIVAAIRQAIAK